MDSCEIPESGKDSPRSGGNVLLEELLRDSPRTDFLDFQFIVLTLLAGIVALFGLFLNNVSVIIGAMVISPLLEPIYAGTIFLANGAFKKFLKHLTVVLVLVLMLIVASAITTWTLSFFIPLTITPEISSRLQQQEISAVLAIILGITTIFAHKRGFVTSVIGIGIAVALVPPAVVTGITIILLPSGIFDALSLTLNNVFGLFAGMLIAILVLNVGPQNERVKKLAWRKIYLILTCIAGLLLMLWYSLTILHHG